MKIVGMEKNPAKTTGLNHLLIVVLLIVVAGNWSCRTNLEISENVTAVNSDSSTTFSATGNINEPEMVVVQGGRFTMGSIENNNEKPIHYVTLSSFKIAKYETTLAQWQQVMGSNPSRRKDCMDCPVTAVSWDDIQTFLMNRLSSY